MTPIEELTAAEMAESNRSKALAAARHAAELGTTQEEPAPLAVAPSKPIPVVTPTAPIAKPAKSLSPSFLKHLEEEIQEEEIQAEEASLP